MAADSANSKPSQSESPNKRLKTTEDNHSKSDSKPESQQLSQNSPYRSLCAICFVGGDGDGKPSRGEIDCCEHYYCFLCIVEWARTESRCPVCRRRFATIRRPPKHGVFARERIINVPVRDQAFSETGAFDPYAAVSCNVCHSEEDDCLLLLCDLCDLAAHTYCVGLGATVPEGEWFCHDCSLSRAERANSEKEAQEDIGQELAGLVASRPPPIISSDSKRSSTPAVPNQEASASEEVTRQRAKTFVTGLDKNKTTDSGARTLKQCRDVHSRIRVMRENWNALRSGSLSFSSSSSHKPCQYSQKHENYAAPHHRSGQVESSSSMGCQQSTDQVGSGSYDINRAWKMMDIVKSKKCGHGKISSLQSSKVPLSKAGTTKERTIAGSSCARKSEQFVYRRLGGNEMEKSLKGNKCRFLESEKEKKSRVITNEAAGCSNLSTNCSRLLLQPALSNSVPCVAEDAHQEHCSSNVTSERDGLACSVRQVASNSFDVRSEVSASSEVDTPKGRRHGGAKSEIQSLVKLNLKVLIREKRLGVDLFKEIARFATHTILAACGLEHHKKYGSHAVPSLVCSHADHSPETPMSNVMSNSCEQCFYTFVKDVVTSIMFERAGFAKSS